MSPWSAKRLQHLMRGEQLNFLPWAPVEVDSIDRVLRIMRFGTASGSFTQVYEATPNELDIWHGMPLFLHLSGDICIVYTEGQLMVSAWKRGRMVIITQVRTRTYV